VRAFEGIQRPRGGEYSEDEWLEFTEAFQLASYEGVSPAEEIPAWFSLDDPIREIFDRDPDEWEWFERWIGAITGQKLTKAREDERDSKLAYAEAARTDKIAAARVLLEQYFATVSDISDAEREGDRESAARYRVLLRGASASEMKALKMGREPFVGLTDQLEALGVADPAKQKGLPEPLKDRIEWLLSKAFPEAELEQVDPNVLKSQLFDPAFFSLDRKARTIRHTEAFQEAFAARFDGRDSECVVRRAARGMWEHVKRHGMQVKKGERRSTEYSLLYSVMLSYMAWTVPCPAVMERRMSEMSAGRFTGDDAKVSFLSAFNGIVAATLRGEGALDEEALMQLALEQGLDPISAREALEAALIRDSVQAEVALPDVPKAAREAKLAVEKGLGARTVPGKRRLVVMSEESAPETLFSVGPEPSDEDLVPNAPPHRYLTPNVLARGCRLIANSEAALPSTLQMIAAMTAAF
jgi:hypothetical protein